MFVVLIYVFVGCPDAMPEPCGFLPSAPGNLQCSCSSHAGSARTPWFFILVSCSVFSSQPADTIVFFRLVCLFSPWPFSSFRSLGWKIDVAGCAFYYYLAWSVTAMLEPRGVFHQKGKDITFTVKKSLYMMSFPPLPPKRKGGKAVWCFWSGRATSIHPSPFFCCVLSYTFLFYKLQTPAAKQWKGVFNNI